MRFREAQFGALAQKNFVGNGKNILANPHRACRAPDLSGRTPVDAFGDTTFGSLGSPRDQHSFLEIKEVP